MMASSEVQLCGSERCCNLRSFQEQAFRMQDLKVCMQDRDQQP